VILRKNITLTEGPSKVLLVTVTDAADRMLAANIANEIGRKANEVNKAIYISNMQQRIKVYNTLYSDLKNQMSADTKELRSSIDSLQTMLAGFSRNFSSRTNEELKGIAALQSHFNDISREIEESVHNYLVTSNIYAASLKTVEEDKLPFVGVLL